MTTKRTIWGSAALAAAVAAGSAIAYHCTPLRSDSEAMSRSFCARQLVKSGIVPSAASIAGEAGSVALAKAVRAGDAQLALALLRLGAKPAAAGDGPMHFAAVHGHGDILRSLLQYGADANQEGEDKTTPLMLAAAAGNDSALCLLLHAGADPDKRDGLGRTALMFAAQSAHAETTELLLQAGAAPNAVDPQKRTALFYALWADKPDNVRALVKGGAFAGFEDAEGRTPLMYAAEGRPECMKVLLASPSTDLDAKDRYGDTALDHAAFHQSVECAHLLRQALRREAVDALAREGIDAARYGCAMRKAAAAGNGKRLRLLLKAGADPDSAALPPEAQQDAKPQNANARDGEPLAGAPAMGPGVTPLMAAAAHGRQNCMRILLEAGADPARNDLSDLPQSALSYAAAGGHADCVRLLAKVLDPAWIKGDGGAQAMLSAAMNGRKRCANLLRKAGVDPNAYLSCTLLLERAASGNDKRATEILIAAGADASKLAFPSACGLDCLPLLYKAGADPNKGFDGVVRDGDAKRLRCLLDAGAVPTQGSALIAVRRRHAEALAMLVAAGADLDARDIHGRTPLMLAANGSYDGERKPGMPERRTNDWRKAAEKNPPDGISRRSLNILLRAGADPNARDRFGMTAAMYAAYQGRPHCLQQLLRHGADPSLANEDGETALDLALRGKKYHCIRILQAALPPAPPAPTTEPGQTSADPVPPAPAASAPAPAAPVPAAPVPAPPPLRGLPAVQG